MDNSQMVASWFKKVEELKAASEAPGISDEERAICRRRYKDYALHTMQDTLNMLQAESDECMRLDSASFMKQMNNRAKLTCDETTCDVKNGSLKCSACKMARYCSKECQAKHWPVHKQLCKRARAILMGVADVDRFEDVKVKEVLVTVLTEFKKKVIANSMTAQPQ